MSNTSKEELNDKYSIIYDRNKNDLRFKEALLKCNYNKVDKTLFFQLLEKGIEFIENGWNKDEIWILKMTKIFGDKIDREGLKAFSYNLIRIIKEIEIYETVTILQPRPKKVILKYFLLQKISDIKARSFEEWLRFIWKNLILIIILVILSVILIRDCNSSTSTWIDRQRRSTR